MLRWKTLAAFLGVMAIASLASAATISITDAIGQSFSGNPLTGPFTSLGTGAQTGAICIESISSRPLAGLPQTRRLVLLLLIL